MARFPNARSPAVFSAPGMQRATSIGYGTSPVAVRHRTTLSFTLRFLVHSSYCFAAHSVSQR
jgi:hypothetical protein